MRPLVWPLVAALALPLPALAQALRPAVATLLLRAERQLQSGDYGAALGAVNAAAKIADPSPAEALAIAELRGAAAAGAGQYKLAAQSYETVLAAGQATPAGRLQLIQAIAGFEARTGDQAATAVWAERYADGGGTDPDTRALAPQAEFAQGRYRQALDDIDRDAAEPGMPLAELQIEAAAARKTGDRRRCFAALEGMLGRAPDAATWNAAIALVQNQPGFPDSLTLDAERLRFATHTLTAPADFEDYAERAILAGDPGEARQVLTAGFADRRLTPATDNGHAARLLRLAGQPAAAPPAAGPSPFPLDASIMQGARFDAVPGYAADDPADPQAALARLWHIRTGRS